MRRVVLALLAVLAVSSLAWKLRAAERAIEKDADESERYVDMGVLLSVVRMDLEHGLDLEAGKPPVRIVAQHRMGGMLDTWTRKIVGPSQRPRYWQCSEQQAALILHSDDLPLWLLVQGSEGGGKTTTLAMWIYARVVEHAGHDREIGVTAPVFARLGHVKKAANALWDPKWYRWKEREQVYRFLAGPRVQLVSAHQQSEDAGSPIQGANWVACASDELQDHFDRNDDINARGRSAPGGKYKRLCTSTFKDSSEWRTFRDVATKSGEWHLAKLLGQSSPFIWPSYWAKLRAGGITDREWRRRVLAEDVGPERQLYHCWSRTVDGMPGNLRPVPLGAIDVTAETLAAYASPGERLTVLAGHDPGKRQHVTEFFKAYRFPGDKPTAPPRWFAVDEITSPESTMQVHVQQVLARAREVWHCNTLDRRGQPDPHSGRLLVRADPHTRSGDEHPSDEVYTVWRAAGIKIRAAAYQVGSTNPAQIKREDRFDLVNTLLCDVNKVRRLFVACDDKGRPACPQLVKAFETMQRDLYDKGEAGEKGADDLSHWPAATGYALWQIEHPRLSRRVA